MAHSANPFEAGWYGAEVTWKMLFCLVNNLNSSLVMIEALSVTSISGNPYVAKTDRR